MTVGLSMTVRSVVAYSYAFEYMCIHAFTYPRPLIEHNTTNNYDNNLNMRSIRFYVFASMTYGHPIELECCPFGGKTHFMVLGIWEPTQIYG